MPSRIIASSERGHHHGLPPLLVVSAPNLQMDPYLDATRAPPGPSWGALASHDNGYVDQHDRAKGVKNARQHVLNWIANPAAGHHPPTPRSKPTCYFLPYVTFRVQLFSPGPRFSTTSVYLPLSFGVNLRSQDGPGLSSLSTSFLPA
jgi:hypothetical protein